MKLICKLFRLDPDSREGIITATSGLCILANFFIASIKVVVGLLSSSIAIISEGVNNASDVLTSLLTLIGTRLAGKHPDEKHPFGYGRIEYLTSLVIAVLILIAGAEMLLGSAKRIFEPADLSISYIDLAIVAVSAVVKFFLGNYAVKMGKKADSGALEAVGLENRNDAFVSTVTIASALIFVLFHISLDAWAGLFTSAMILKAGIEVLSRTVSELLGRPGEKELAQRLYRKIRATDGVLNAADMMLHNYGPDAWSGSVNLEIDHKKTVGEIYQFLHALQLRIMHEDHVTMVFGVYAVDGDDPQSRQLRRNIGQFIREQPHVKSFHAVYTEPESRKIYCDFVVDYKLTDWEPVKEAFLAYMDQLYPGHEVVLTIETEYV